jgi:hypothetical protein
VAARDAYVEGVDLTLAALDGGLAKLEEAVAHDPNFALAHIAIARHHQVWGNPAGVQAPLAAALAVQGLTVQEASHVGAFALLMSGKVREGYMAVRAHLVDYPRDALVASTCMGVFSLIGFSGQPGREAELLAFSTSLAPHYGDDWWFTGVHAFSMMEAGQVGPAAAMIETSLKGHARNATAAHIRSHLYYENGETDAGMGYLRDWMKSYEREGLLHCHLSWHVALWALEQGDEATMWSVFDASVAPDASVSPALNVVTDSASLLYRAGLRGVDVTPERWAAVSAHAARCFPKPGLAFADVHAALAHAMAGNSEGLALIIEGAKGPAGDVVLVLAEAFKAIASGAWAAAEAHLVVALQDHARIGGSRAQRDLIEFAMASVLLRQDRSVEARQLLAIRRPVATHAGSVIA